MNNFPLSSLLAAGIAMALSAGATADEISKTNLASPSGKIAVDFYLTDKGQPAYRASFAGKPVIGESLLGLDFKSASDMLDDFSIVDVKTRSADSTWEQPWGEEHYIRDHFNEAVIALEEKGPATRKLNLIFRAYDDGLAFRYQVPQQQGLDKVEIMQEATEFNLLGNHSSWWTPALAGEKYEYLTENTPLDQVKLVHTPFTMKDKSGLAIAIHEAALKDYATMNLAGNGTGLKAALVPIHKDSPVKVETSTPFASPWRTVQIAEKETDLITSYLTLNLNEPNQLGDASWIKPGKYVGIWWELHLEKGTWNQGPKHAATTENTKKYIDFAAANGFDGVLVEGWNWGWDGEWFNHGGAAFNFTKPYPDYDVDTLSKYAADKGVYIIGHHETGAETDNYERQLEDAYDFLQKHGMKAVKTGYVESGELLTNGNYHHGQKFVQHAEKVTKVAAAHKVMVVAHETVKDTGERRTYPNLISREVARGQEYDAWAKDGGNPPDHTTIIPFTRLLAGPMDFTPGTFDISLPSRPDNQVNTTLAKQLALYVVIYSPVQMASDLPENYAKYPDAFQFIKDVATDWETTKVLSGEIGEHIAIARQQRDSENWFVGAITDEKARDIAVNLDFLNKDLSYTATIYRDGDKADYRRNPEDYVIETRKVKAGDKVRAQLAAGGGMAISLLADPH
ncbi:glycoside hydrolase family 97 protein [Microbulbifer sp. CAU 1566]|uniref:glycoside hydrolase family 97 protein n=1 Tax=Microbulbifer sp. CAU 1566 TaxID=2933269 RepID=UPI0020060F8C|nr:glycoside hydrolase family 97 protein [Microbulbifer sp. CAU 1566]MCK7598576.1 glycoside hydrolase family 97 protein [Microbulbifer sp. CAU 1566]